MWRTCFVVMTACSLYVGSDPAPGEPTDPTQPTQPTEPTQLVRVDDEPPGANCASGGQAIRTGADLNGNGILDDSEVTSITYACDSVSVVRIDPVSAGQDGCLDAGFAIHVGSDANGDGLLEDAEIASTTYACQLARTIAGDVTIRSEADVAELADVGEITGSLVINSPDPLVVALPNLRHLGGDLDCGAHGLLACSLTALSLPNLESAQHIELCANGDCTARPDGAPLKILDLSTLASAELIALDGVGDIVDVNLPALTSGTVTLRNNPALTSVELPLMRSGAVNVSDDALVSMDLPTFTIGAIAVVNTQLTTLSLPAFQQGELGVLGGALTAISAPSLESVNYLAVVQTSIVDLSFPALTSAQLGHWGGINGFSVRDNPALRSLSVPRISQLDGGLTMTNNPTLPNCVALTLWANVGYVAPVAISGNDESVACP